MAYAKLYKNKGALTTGTTKETVQSADNVQQIRAVAAQNSKVNNQLNQSAIELEQVSASLLSSFIIRPDQA